MSFSEYHGPGSVFRPRWSPTIYTAWAILVLVAIGCPVCSAQAPGGKGDGVFEPGTDLTFRRVFAPADQIDAWPRGAQPYVPVDSEEFERLIDLAETSRFGARGALAPRIATAHYEAHLVDGDLVVGSGSLRIEHARDEPAFLVLNPCKVAIAQATWEDGGLPARMGLDARGRWVVLVPGSGTLRFDWSRRLSGVGSSVFRLPLQLPRGALATMTLTCPTEFNVTGEAVSVEATDALGREGRTAWQCAFATSGEPALLLRQQAEDGNAIRSASVVQLLSYQVTPEGLALNCELSLDVGNQSLTQLELELDAPLQLVSAAINEQSLPWSTLDDDNRVHHVLLEFDEPIVEPTLLRLFALAPLQRERLAQFPRVRIRDIGWRQGTIRIAALSSLVIDDIETHGCRQMKSEVDTDGQRFAFQMFSPDGHVDALVRQRDQRVQVSSATTLTMESDEIHGAMAAEFTATQGRRFELYADVGSAWQLESLASDPPGAIESWRVAPMENGKRQLHVRLRHGLSGEQPLRIVLRAERAAPPFGDLIGMAELEFVRFDETDRGDRLLELRTDGSCRLNLVSTAGTIAMDFANLDATRRRLFVEPALATVYELGHDSELVVALGARMPRFSVDILMRLVVDPVATLDQTVIRCVPNGQPVERILVRFSQQAKASRRWSLGSPDGKSVEVVALTQQERERFGSAATGEAVVVRLPSPRDKPFELWAVRSFDNSETVELGLVTVPDAAEQTGRIVIEAAPSLPIAIDAHRLKSEVPRLPVDGRFTKTRASYRFDPRADFDLARPTVITVRSTEENVPRSDVVVWSSRVDSSIASSGRAMHLARYWLENAGRRELKIRVPEGCRVNGVWVDDAAVSRRVSQDELSVPLPPSVRYVEVMVQLRSDGPRLGLTGVHNACWPEPNAPVLGRQSSIRAPANYDVFATGAAAFTSNTDGRSWVERLFGPFGRPTDVAPFGPDELDGWLARISATNSVETNRAVDALLARFGVAIESTIVADQNPVDAAGAEATWGNLLEAWDAIAQSEQTPLLIDVHALAAQGIDARRPFVDVARAVPRIQMLTLLRRARLAMVLHGRTIVLTTATATSAIADHLEAVYGSTIVRDRGTTWDQSIRRAGDGMSARFAVVDSWKSRSRWPWPIAAARSSFEAELCRPRTIASADPSSEIRYRLVDKTRLGFVGGAMFVAVLFAALWHGRGHLEFCLMATVVIAATSLFVPSWLVPISSSAVLGAIAFWAICLLTPSSDRRSDPGTPTGNRPAMSVARTLAFVAAAAMYGTGALLSAEDDLNGDMRTQATPWVFVPVDEDRQPTGDRYHVPIDFDRRLRQYVSQATEKPQGWMLGEVSYEASLSWDVARAQLQLDALTATYNFEVLDVLSVIELPLPAGARGSDTISARRNGNAMPLPYHSESHTFAVPVGRRGSYHVEVELDAKVEHGSMASGFSLPIPAIPTSRVVVHLPSDAPPLVVDSALGRVDRTADGSTVEADLGGSDSLTLSWPTAGMRRDMQPNGEVDELTWLRVEPTVVVVQTRFHLHVTSGSIDQLDIEVDPQLRLLPLGDANTVVSGAEFVEDDKRILRFHLDPPVSDEATISASFLLQDASAIGRLSLPRLAALGPRRRQRLLAVSLDPGLRADRAQGNGFEEIPTADFVAVWEQTSDVPNMSFRMTNLEPQWSLPIRTAAPRISAAEALTVDFQSNHAEVEFVVDLETQVGATFQLRVRVPDSLEVELVSTAVEPLVRRWTRLPSGDIAVFLDGAMTESQQLRLRGTIPTPAEGEFVIPDIGMIGCETTDRQVEVYRRPSVLVTSNVESPLAGAAVERAQTATSARRLVIALSGEDVPREWSVRLAVNQPIAEVTLVTALHRKADAWRAEVDCLLEVQQGVVDLLELWIPSQWSEPLVLEPPLPYRIVAATGEQPATLIIRPIVAVEDSLRVTITSTLDITSGQRVTTPTIAAIGVQASQSFICLPDLAAMQRLEWETRGLLPSVLPDTMLEEEVSEGLQDATVYEVVGNDSQAVLRSASKGDRVPIVWLADVHVVVHGPNACNGVATFDLDPAGAESCPLEIPQGYELIRVRIGEQPATLRKNEQGQWNVMLGSSDLPHRIEVVYRRQSHASSSLWSSMQIAAPSLGALAVERTLWTVYTAPGVSVEYEGPDFVADQAIEFDLLRLDSMEPSFIAVADAQVDHPSDELQRWAEPWLRRWIASRQQLEQKVMQSTLTHDNPVLQAELKLVDNEHARAVAALGMGDLHEQLLKQQGRASISAELLEASTMSDYGVRQIAATGSLVNLDVSVGRSLTRGIGSGLAVVLVLIIGAWWFWKSERRQWSTRFARRWSLASIVGVGVLWWLFLWPSWFGWVIAFAAIWYAVNLPTRRRASSASTANRTAAYSR